ncbi:hypothetical protein AGMMS49938_16330 [Fibrobacterales bacterium]|nr:hypothetical protein AGMMS49938_16330 [Fibrobacterales bacterium]
MNVDKAYLLGLLVGGGTIGKDSFQIEIPLKSWGETKERMVQIFRDLSKEVLPKFKKEFGISVEPDSGNGVWKIITEYSVDLSKLIDDLTSLGLPTKGFLLDSVNLEKCKQELSKDSKNTESFLAGLFDTRASLEKSHRRFVDEAPIVSLEIPGRTQNFLFVVQLCEWLNDLGTVTDQILFNHPSQHSPSDPIYKNWKKGFKVRFLAKDFLLNNAFAFRSKAQGVSELKTHQTTHSQGSCLLRKLTSPNPVSIHSEIKDKTLPKEVQGKIFLHYLHFCAVLGCKYAPQQEVKNMVKHFYELVSAAPLLQKDFNSEDLLAEYAHLCSQFFLEQKIKIHTYKVNSFLEQEQFSAYPKRESAIAFLFAENLKGKRPGPQQEIIRNSLTKSINLYALEGTVGTPIALVNAENQRGAIISAVKSEANKKMLTHLIKCKGFVLEVLQ